MSEDIKTIDIKEFRELGYLQEINRQFLHPLGMALSIRIDEDGTEHLDSIWDSREDPEGFRFENPSPNVEKALRVIAAWDEKASYRLTNLGYIVQPFGEE